MPTDVVTCPSGLRGEIKGIKVKAGRLFSDKALQKSGKLIDKVLEACWVRTEDLALYSDIMGSAGSPDWGRVLVADRFFLVTRIRQLTYGDQYWFRHQCQNGMCDLPFDWGFFISKLKVTDMPARAKTQWRQENKFTTTLAGKQAFYKLLNGGDEVRTALEQAEKRAKKDDDPDSEYNLLVEAALPRIIEVEGVKHVDLPEWLEELDLPELEAFIEETDEMSGGVETSVEMRCPHCRFEQTSPLPFSQGLFNSATAKRKAGGSVALAGPASARLTGQPPSAGTLLPSSTNSSERTTAS